MIAINKLVNYKITPHFFNYDEIYSTTKIICSDCGFEREDDIHFRNGGQICDNPDGPCACGAWHFKDK